MRARELGCVTLDLALIETYSTVWKHVLLLRRIPAERALEYADGARSIYESSIIRVYRLLDVCRDALRLSITYGVSVYDAAYLALASELGYRVASFDLKLAEALKGTDLAGLIYVPP